MLILTELFRINSYRLVFKSNNYKRFFKSQIAYIIVISTLNLVHFHENNTNFLKMKSFICIPF